MILMKIVALFLLVKSSRYKVQELLKNDCHILLYYDYEQVGHISYVFHEETKDFFRIVLIATKIDLNSSNY